MFGFLKKSRVDPTRARASFRTLLEDQAAIEDFAAMFGAENLRVPTLTARKTFLMWLLRRHGHSELEAADMPTVGDAFISAAWGEYDLEADKVRLGDWLIEPGERAEVSMRLMERGIRIEPPAEANPAQLIAAIDALERAQQVPIKLLLPLLFEIRFRHFDDAWNNSGERGVLNPLTFGILASQILRRQITGEFEMPDRMVDFDRGTTIVRIVQEVFLLVKSLKR